MATETQDELISVRQAAKECGRNPETVRRWIWNGKLTAEKLGNQLFVKRSVLEAFTKDLGTDEPESNPRPDFLERAMAIQNRIKARGGAPGDAGQMVGKMRAGKVN